MRFIFLFMTLIPNITFSASLKCQITVIIENGAETTFDFSAQPTLNGVIDIKEIFDLSNEQFSLKIKYKPEKPCGNADIDFRRQKPSELSLLWGHIPLCENKGFDLQSLVHTPAFRIDCRLQ